MPHTKQYIAISQVERLLEIKQDDLYTLIREKKALIRRIGNVDYVRVIEEKD